MSLVGTRPPTVDEWDKYELHHRARLATKPGLTGMWQVSGRSNITDLDKIFSSISMQVNVPERSRRIFQICLFIRNMRMIMKWMRFLHWRRFRKKY